MAVPSSGWPTTSFGKLGLTPGRTLTVDRARRPANGDLVWVELVRYGSTQRLIRRYTLAAGWIALSLPRRVRPGDHAPSRATSILGVVDIDTDTPPGSAASSPALATEVRRASRRHPFDIGLAIVAATALAYVARLLRQPLLLAYIGAGLLIGPPRCSGWSTTRRRSPSCPSSGWRS